MLRSFSAIRISMISVLAAALIGLIIATSGAYASGHKEGPVTFTVAPQIVKVQRGYTVAMDITASNAEKRPP